MEDIKVYFAANLSRLRNGSGMTQSELGEKLSYSDKAVSKWERAESLPDAYALKSIAELFNVTVDSLLSDPAAISDVRAGVPEKRHFWQVDAIMAAVMGIWVMSLTLFVVFWILGSLYWFILACAVPTSLVTALVLNSVWNSGRYNYYIVSGLVLSVALCVYVFFLKYNPWQLFLILIPSEALVFFCFRIARKIRASRHK